MPLADLLVETNRWIDEGLAQSTGAECVTSSFQAECVVLVHMLIARRPRIPVLFLDTGYHFAETYTYRDRLATDWNLNLVNLLPKSTVAEQESQFGLLYQTQPDRCCGMRKVGPLFAALEDYGSWFTGLRREQSKSRAELRPVDLFKLPSGKQISKISPLAEWPTQLVWAYVKEHGLPALPLYEEGYTSIGCVPCTTLPLDPNDPRSGRWSGKKLECGIHLQG